MICELPRLLSRGKKTLRKPGFSPNCFVFFFD